MAETFFVTGTDTGVGKTHAGVAVIHALRAQGRTVAGYKPVASGCEQTPEGLRNEDALALLRASGGDATYEQVNPYAFEPPIAPHLAAERAQVTIDLAVLDAAHTALAARHDYVIVEGAGGWLVPITARETFADWVQARQWPVILVVGIRLGCINHALLSVEAIERRTRLAGWIANCVPPAVYEAEGIIESLAARISAPLLGILPANQAPEQAFKAMSIELLGSA